MSNASLLSLSARPDRDLAWEGGGSIRYIVVDVRAPEAVPEAASKRLPLNLGIVVDASGSMSGEPLEAAKEASCGIASRLCETDVLSVVSFADDVQVHVDGLVQDPGGQKAAISAIRGLETRGQTNLSSGWFKGAESVAKVMQTRPGLHNRVILLSDGHANAGILNPIEMGGHAEQLLSRGLATSTVGIGDGYNPEFLRVLAENGGGTMHDAEHPHEIAEVLLAELGDIKNLVAETLRVSIRCPDGVRVKIVESGDPQFATEATVRFGAVTANSRRRAVFLVRTPRGEAGESLKFVIEARWKAPGEDEEHSTATTVGLTLAPGSASTPQPRNLEATEAAGTAWHAAILRHAARLNRARQWAEASRYLEQELRFFRPYAAGIRSLELLVDELEALHREAARDWGERSRKEVEMVSYRRLQGKSESRRTARPMNASAIIGAKPAAPLTRWDYPLTCEEEHWIVVIDGQRFLLDTGSPVSVGTGVLRFAGRTMALHSTFAGTSIRDLTALVGVGFDGLLGMDALGQHKVTFDGRKGVLRVESGALPPTAAITASEVMGVPTVPVDVDGVARRAFLDLGAKISYVAGGVSDGLELIEDFYPGIGRFSTTAGLAAVTLGALQCELRFGKLPPALETTLMVAGCDAILGAELLHHAVLHWDFPGNRLALEGL